MGRWLISKAGARTCKLSIKYNALPENKKVLKDERGHIKVKVNATGQTYLSITIWISESI